MCFVNFGKTSISIFGLGRFHCLEIALNCRALEQYESRPDTIAAEATP